MVRTAFVGIFCAFTVGVLSHCEADVFTGADSGADAAPQETGAPIDGATSADAGTEDASAVGCDASTFVTTASADTMLLDVNNPNPSIRFGKTDTLDVGLQGCTGCGQSPVLLRFPLTNDMIGALAVDGGATSATLTVTMRASGGACGGNCPNGATNFFVFAANDAWNEGNGGSYSGAEWTNKVGNSSTSQTPWEVPGAKGATDRSTMVLASATVTSNQAATAGPIEITFAIDAAKAAELRTWSTNGNLSLLLAPTSGGTLFIMSREGKADASQLSISACK